MKRESFRYTITAWLLFFGGFGVEVGIDHFLRTREGRISAGGLPELVWFGIPILLGAASAWLAWRATQSLRSTWRRAAIVSGQLVVGFIIYSAACLGYVVQSGIDSL